MCVDALGARRRVSDPLEMAVNHPSQVLGTEFGFSGRAASVHKTEPSCQSE